jgi:hypothetical protein
VERRQRHGRAWNSPNDAEQAWHFLLWGFDSGFMYYGTGLDDEVKATFAANRAIALAQPVVAGGTDRTPPTVFRPQRFPWNPGGQGRGQLLGGLTSGGGTVGYTTPPWPSDFHVWTLVHDVSGVTGVVLKVRADAERPLRLRRRRARRRGDQPRAVGQGRPRRRRAGQAFPRRRGRE